MAGSRNLGTGTANRLAQRLDRSQLQRVTVPGGGEAFTGPVASRALDALGARAMTLDRSVIVSEDFDPSKAEDKALLAHEEAASIAEDMRKQRREAEAFTSQIAKIKQQYEDQLKRTYSQSVVLANKEAVNSHGSDVDWKQKAIPISYVTVRMIPLTRLALRRCV